MLDDFFMRALLAGIGVALATGPLGCFVVWRRMAYFGDTLAHSALLGVVLGFILSIQPMAGVALTCSILAILMVLMQYQRRLSSDTFLGLMAHSTLAIGLLAVAFMPAFRVDLLSYLFGDILAVSTNDLAIIYIGLVVVLVGIVIIWRPLLALTVNEELARAEGVHVLAVRLVFTLLLAIVIAVAMRVVGLLLVTSLLIIPAAAARRFAPTPEFMAVAAAGLGVLAVIGGLQLSLAVDTPSGPSIVVTALALFILSQLAGLVRLNSR
ncbi:MAG: iron chelate uptake ABC transporter family permease subunit [Pseudomonadota bacterium]